MKIQKKSVNNKGLTLVELVIYMGILSLLLVVFIDMFALLVNRQLETESLSAVQQDENYLLSRLGYEFGRASSITLPISPGSPSAQLRLIIEGEQYDLFSIANELLASSSGKLIALNSNNTSISNLSFQRLGSGDQKDVVQVAFDISSAVKKQSGFEVTHFSSTFGIREK